MCGVKLVRIIKQHFRFAPFMFSEQLQVYSAPFGQREVMTDVCKRKVYNSTVSDRGVWSRFFRWLHRQANTRGLTKAVMKNESKAMSKLWKQENMED